MTTLYTDAIALEIEVDNHGSDLYLPYTNEVKALLKKHGVNNAEVFRSAIDGSLWLDCPFRYDPFWRKNRKD